MPRVLTSFILSLLIVLSMLNSAYPSTIHKIGEKIPLGKESRGPIVAWVNITEKYLVVSIPINKALEEKTGINSLEISYGKSREAGILALVSYYFKNNTFLQGYRINPYEIGLFKENYRDIKILGLTRISMGRGLNKSFYKVEIVGRISLNESGETSSGYRIRFNGKVRVYCSSELGIIPPADIINDYIKEIENLTPITRIIVLDMENLRIRGPVNGCRKGASIEMSYRLYHVTADIYVPLNTPIHEMMKTLRVAGNNTRLRIARSIGTTRYRGEKYYDITLTYDAGGLPITGSLETLYYNSQILRELDNIKVFNYMEPIPYLNATMNIVGRLNNSIIQYIYHSSQWLGTLHLPGNAVGKPGHIYMILRKNIDPEKLVDMITEWLEKYSYSDKDRVSIVFGIHDYKSGGTRFIMKEITYKPGAGTNTALYATIIIGAVVAGILAWSFWRKRRKPRIIVISNEKT